jgi:hypothetical protein
VGGAELDVENDAVVTLESVADGAVLVLVLGGVPGLRY